MLEIIDLEILSPLEEPRPSIYINHKFLGFSPLSAFGDGVRTFAIHCFIYGKSPRWSFTN